MVVSLADRARALCGHKEPLEQDVSIAALTGGTIETDEPLITRDATILLLEYDDVFRTVAVRTLIENGHNTLDTSHYEIALDLISDNVGCVDLLIMPASLRGMDGVRFIQEVRQFDQNMKVILTYYTSETAERYRSLADLNFLHKPFSMTQLIAAVDAVKATDHIPRRTSPVRITSSACDSPIAPEAELDQPTRHQIARSGFLGDREPVKPPSSTETARRTPCGPFRTFRSQVQCFDGKYGGNWNRPNK